MGKQRFHRNFTVFKEGAHFVLLITFCHIGHMDATRGIGCLLKGDIGCCLSLASVSDKNIVGIDTMGHRGLDGIVIVAQFDGDIDGNLRKRYQENILK